LNQQDEILIESGRSARHYWTDLWRYRELFAILAWRDISVRYKQTVLGVLWAVLPPFVTMIIMTVVFAKVAGLPTQGTAPYAIMVFAGLLPWQLFAGALGAAGNSLVGSSHLISKVYLPRLIIPASSVAVSFCDSLISLGVLGLLMAWYQFIPSAKILLLPFLLVAAALAAFGPGLLLSALNIKYRDFRFIVPFVVQFGLYLSPVGFSSQVVREKFGETLFNLYCLNPMVSVIEGFRWAVLGGSQGLEVHHYLIGLTVSLICLWLGISYFRQTERSFADVI
jgi:lipopolysaccharide transport system permease protein